jgi:hypothetical protein
VLVTVNDPHQKLRRKGEGLARSIEYAQAQFAHWFPRMGRSSD